MALSAVQKNNSNDLRRQSFLKSGVLGATFAYAAKWAIPITPQEKEDVFLSEELQAKNDANVVKQEIELIKSENKNVKGLDDFVRLCEDDKLDFSEAPKNKVTLSEDLSKLYIRVVSKVAEVRKSDIESRAIHTKGIRPVLPFVATGVIIGLLSAAVHNVRYENAKFKN